MDITSFLTLSTTEFELHLQNWVADWETQFDFLQSEGTAVVRERGLRLLNGGSRSAMIEEATVLQFQLDHPANQAWRARQPEVFGQWQAIAQLLHDAARQSGPASLEVILRSHSKHGRQLLEILAASDQPVLRKQLREQLQITESQMSHLLADLERASLIRKITSPGRKAVALELDWAGEQAAEQFRRSTIQGGQESIHRISSPKNFDNNSLLRMSNIGQRQHFPIGLLTVRKASDKPLEYLKIKLSDILVSGLQHGGSGNSDTPSENLSLDFAKFEIEYYEQMAEGVETTADAMNYGVAVRLTDVSLGPQTELVKLQTSFDQLRAEINTKVEQLEKRITVIKGSAKPLPMRKNTTPSEQGIQRKYGLRSEQNEKK